MEAATCHISADHTMEQMYSDLRVLQHSIM